MARYDPEKLIYPDVLAAVKPGDENTNFARWVEAVTNNQDTVIRTSVYWYVPPADAENREPVLMIEIDDEVDPDGDNMDIRVRVRRNDGLVYEGTREEQ